MSSCKRSAFLDAFGGAVSLLCAIHCLVLPLILPFAAAFIHNIWIEVGMVAAAIGVGWFALAHGYRSHGFRWPAVFFGLGMACILTGNWVLTGGRPIATLGGEDHTLPSIIFVAIGGALIVTAHVLNYLLERHSPHGNPKVGVKRQVV